MASDILTPNAGSSGVRFSVCEGRGRHQTARRRRRENEPEAAGAPSCLPFGILRQNRLKNLSEISGGGAVIRFEQPYPRPPSKRTSREAAAASFPVHAPDNRELC